MGDCNGDTAIHSAAERGRLEVRQFHLFNYFFASQKHQVLKHFLKIHVESLRILAVSGAFF